ncbi:o-succinylbenzoate--CoA ligase [Acrocarpospora macrocephala]|uniref:O-succinylbenzoic acid--CoA ligase n=1 Tax=Acrocarpospora macrocephala TaxID=150177 RepID=A0A5M3WV98_9ACTN|nr:AMP-binding protein [Acrocarpospora macrocephala]GES12396.1 O-succinylbenzoic acid--CoA ligase [Acrocarpospora macrocephala]
MPERAVHALLLPPGPELLESVRKAVFAEGPAVLPLSPGLPAAALKTTLDALRPTHVITQDGVERVAGGAPARAEVAVIIATSGSTGAPKGVELSAAALVASAAASLQRIGAAGERWLCCLPTSHISGLQVLVRAMLSETVPIVHERFSAGAVAASGAGHVSLVPTQLRRLVDSGADLSGFRTILLGGAAAPPDLLAAHPGIVTTYGMSETSGGCVYDGTPLYNVDLEIGPDGRITIGGPVLFSGYRFGEPFGGGRYRTSDLGIWEAGRLTVLGRADDVINTGGQKVVAGTVAAVLAEHPGVDEVAVLGRPDPEWGEIVVAVVAGPAELGELRAFAKERLPAYAAPRAVMRVRSLPLLPNGKPDMVTLRNQI